MRKALNQQLIKPDQYNIITIELGNVQLFIRFRCLRHKIFKSPFLSADPLQAIRVSSSAQTKSPSDGALPRAYAMLH